MPTPLHYLVDPFEFATAVAKAIASLTFGSPSTAIGTYGTDVKVGEWTPENPNTGVNMKQTLVRGTALPRQPNEVMSKIRITIFRRDQTLKLTKEPIRVIMDALAHQMQVTGYKARYEMEGVPDRYRDENDRMVESVSFDVQVLPTHSDMSVYAA